MQTLLEREIFETFSLLPRPSVSSSSPPSAPHTRPIPGKKPFGHEGYGNVSWRAVPTRKTQGEEDGRHDVRRVHL